MLSGMKNTYSKEVFLVFLTTFLSIKLYIFKNKALKENFMEKKLNVYAKF